MSWLGRLLRRRRLEDQLETELRDHLERQAADYQSAGLSEAEAWRRARLDFGGLERAKEYCRDARGTRLLEDVAQDLGHGARVLRRSPVFTLVAVASLALGIGANTAIFTLVDTLLLRSLPVHEPHRLVRLDGGSWTNPIWEALRERRPHALDGLAAYSDTQLDLAQGGVADFAEGIYVSGEFFGVLGVRPHLGRMLEPADDARGGGPEGAVCVLSHAFWHRRFGSDPAAIGRSLALNNVPFTVVGVAAPQFFGASVGRSFDVAVPLARVDRLQENGQGWLEGRSTWWLSILGRLQPGQTVEVATLAVRGVQPQVREATIPESWAAKDQERYLREEPFTLLPAANGFSDLRGQYQRPLYTVMAVVGLVLLIACANLGSLLLARADARRQELAARLALGASRARLARQLLTESLLLAVPGAAFGLAVAQAGSRLLVAQLTLPQGVVAMDVSLHWRVLLFTTVVTLLTAVLFGVAPALRAGRASAQEALQGQARTLVGAGGRSGGGALVVVQVALSLVLVFGAGLFLRTFRALATLDLGLDGESLLLVSMDAQRSPARGAERVALYERARERAAAVPGVAQAAVSLVVPVSGMQWNNGYGVEGGLEVQARERLAWTNASTPGFFQAYGTRLLAGRDFGPGDRRGSPPVAVVNQSFARRFVGTGSPLGRTVTGPGPGGTQARWEIVGLVEDAVYSSPRDPKEPTIYLSLAQLPEEELWPFATVAVRGSAGTPSSLARAVSAAVGALDGRLSLTVRPFRELVGAAVMRERMVALISGFFGGLALFLAGIGLYGVTAYAVGQRRREIGLRMALGAAAGRVWALVLSRALGLVAVGLGIGVGLSLWLSRFVGALLFGVSGSDPWLLATAGGLLVTIALFAAALPARRASRIDPAQVLRES